MKFNGRMLAWPAGCVAAPWVAGGVAVGEPPATAPAVETTPPAEPTSAVPATQPDLVGEEFRSPVYGIAFRPPSDCQKVSSAVPDQVVAFENEQRHWYFKATRVSLSQPLPLEDYKDQFQQPHEGLLEITSKKLQGQPSAEVLMKEIVHVGPHGAIPVGMLAVRYSEGMQRRLLQQAVVEANDRLYYVIELVTPGHRGESNGRIDPDEKLAAGTFNQVVDSVGLLDRAAIFHDQADRLIRTRGLFANWTPRYLQSRLVPEQYFRLLRDGKDVGYTYEVQDLDDKDARIAGTAVVRVGVRSRTTPDADTVVDAESCLVVTVDQKHETWANVAAVTSVVKGKPTQGEITEIGISDAKVKAVAAAGGLDDPRDPNLADPRNPRPQPWIQMQESRPLTVTRKNKQATLNTFEQQMPPFYIPQAISHLLPRLLPYRDARTYLFATYVADGNNGEPAVMLRYVDVLPPQQVKIDGKEVVAVPINDHVGLEGPVTTHYVSPDDGRFLGSVSKGLDQDKNPTTLMILPTDRPTLERLWAKPNLDRPANNLDQAIQSQSPQNQ